MEPIKVLMFCFLTQIKFILLLYSFKFKTTGKLNENIVIRTFRQFHHNRLLDDGQPFTYPPDHKTGYDYAFLKPWTFAEFVAFPVSLRRRIHPVEKWRRALTGSHLTWKGEIHFINSLATYKLHTQLHGLAWLKATPYTWEREPDTHTPHKTESNELAAVLKQSESK